MSTAKKPMSEGERAALAQKLDDDLEQFMEEMAAKRQAEGPKEKKPFDFDEFCKELDQHPAFMTDLSGAQSGPYAEHIEALQALKYDTGETEEDRRDTVEGHKNEGNKHFKLKKYRWAIEAYTNGIKARCADRALNAILHQNRAASHSHIGNHRSAIKDCVIGRKFDPLNLKIVIRGAECLMELGYANDAVKWLDNSLEQREKALQARLEEETKIVGENGDHATENVDEATAKHLQRVKELRGTAEQQTTVEDRDARKRRAEAVRESVAKRKLLNALQERKLNFSPRLPFAKPEFFEWSLVEVNLPQLHEHQRVKLMEDGKGLQWPLLIQYPEVGQTDVMTEVDENTCVGTLLNEVLAEPAEWDTDKTYRMDNVTFFVSDEFDEYVMEVYPWTEFKTMFSYPGYQIKNGLPVLMVLRNDKVSKSFKRIGEENKFTTD